MAKEVGIGVIHGMGSQEAGFAKDMIKEIKRRLKKKHGKNPQKVAWQEILWSGVLKPQQSDYLAAIKAGADVEYKSLRGFMIKYLGDASGYRRTESRANSTYVDVHQIIRDSIKELRNKVQDDSKPLIILAHSLGGHMMSNYIYDIQNTNPAVTVGSNDFEEFKTFSGFITFGCNIPLFTFAYDPVVAIDFPPPGLRADLKSKAKWRNYYDPDDILGYPLKLIGRPPPAASGKPSYDDVVDEDIAINVGGLFASWNPLSHSKYWTDNDFTRPVAKFIADFL